MNEIFRTICTFLLKECTENCASEKPSSMIVDNMFTATVAGECGGTISYDEGAWILGDWSLFSWRYLWPYIINNNTTLYRVRGIAC